jgi:hypothetical protein
MPTRATPPQSATTSPDGHMARTVAPTPVRDHDFLWPNEPRFLPSRPLGAERLRWHRDAGHRLRRAWLADWVGGPGPRRSWQASGDDPVQVCVCMPVHLLVVQPDAARDLGLAEARLGERNLCPAARILGALLALDPAPVSTGRSPAHRVVGTCRHFALLRCAFLRNRGIAARVRCGFATYFQAGQGLDHWVTDYRDEDGRWVRIDTEILGGTVLDNPEALRSREVLTGSEAWVALRRGEIDAERFGVHGTGNWGASEVRGNAVRDLAALNKVEMLPWDERGRMTAPIGARPARTATNCSMSSPRCAPVATPPRWPPCPPTTTCESPPACSPDSCGPAGGRGALVRTPMVPRGPVQPARRPACAVARRRHGRVARQLAVRIRRSPAAAAFARCTYEIRTACVPSA